jgi:D-serine deaminase-like pyridoxal phosphate-dependent protein
VKTKYELQSPAVIVDLDIVERNINKIAILARNAKKKCDHHIKPHKVYILLKS